MAKVLVWAAYQTRQILTEKTITFPLREAPYLIDVKMGKLDYTGEVLPRLEELMDEIESLSQKSDLPEKVDRPVLGRLSGRYGEEIYHGIILGFGGRAVFSLTSNSS